MKILITGANGFLGRNLSNNLKVNHQVYSVVRTLQKKSTLTNPILLDLSSSGDLYNLPKDIDCIIHLAQSSQYREFPKGAIDMMRINVESTARLLEWARATTVKRFVFTSTANVYGESNEYLSEINEVDPSSYYAATKYSAEMLIKQYAEYFDINILRLFTVYGPNQKNMLIPNLIRRISKGEPVFLVGGRGLELTPIFIDDVVFFFNKLLKQNENKPQLITNICGDQVTNLLEIVSIIERSLDKKAIIDNREGIVNSFIGTNTLMKKITGEFNTVSIREGLKRILNA